MGTTAEKLAYLAETKQMLKSTIQTKLSGYITFDTNDFRRLNNYCGKIIVGTKKNVEDGEFTYYTDMTSIILPQSVTEIGDEAFYECASLESVEIGDSIRSIGDYAFYGCTSLQWIKVKAITPPSIGPSTFDTTNNCDIYVPSGSVDVYKESGFWSLYASRIKPIPQE